MVATDYSPHAADELVNQVCYLPKPAHLSGLDDATFGTQAAKL
jgi:hypothetical protein